MHLLGHNRETDLEWLHAASGHAVIAVKVWTHAAKLRGCFGEMTGQVCNLVRLLHHPETHRANMMFVEW